MTPPGAEAPDPSLIPVLVAGVQTGASSDHLEATLESIVEAAVEQVGAAFGALGVLDATGTRIERFVVVGMDAADRERIGRLPTGGGVLGVLTRSPDVLRLDDLREHPASIGFPDGHPPMAGLLGLPVRVQDRVFANLYLTAKRTGRPFTDADERAARALVAVAGLAIANAQMVERAEHRRAWAKAGTDVATALLSGADPDTALRAIAQRVAALSSADATGVLLPSAGDGEEALTIAVAVGVDGEDVEGVRIPLAGTALGEAHRSGLPMILEDVHVQAATGPHAAVVDDLARQFGPMLTVPLSGRPALGTVVALRLRGREPFEPATLELASAFAGQAAVALELARTQLRERRLQVEADRDRIARDLHDHVVQRIFATGLALDGVSRSLQDTHPEVAARLAERVDELDGTIARIRSAIYELHEAHDASPDAVRSQIADVVRSITGGHGIRPDVRLRGDIEELPRTLVPDVIAVVRELVTNVVRHARATRLTATVTVDSELRVVVTDNGIGLPAVTVRSGLTNLADRAERYGGRLTTSAGPSGTQVRWSVPLPRP
ncbi:GAF domain-containing protein [Geodermatophilus sp. CPCC 206100]|uniref:sensor histidine kinase n=1 Tax=Geodermatophilus sp. CPCC 206100 TaxID=3020054 RepID=UPI003AFFCC72